MKKLFQCKQDHCTQICVSYQVCLQTLQVGEKSGFMGFQNSVSSLACRENRNYWGFLHVKNSLLRFSKDSVSSSNKQNGMSLVSKKQASVLKPGSGALSAAQRAYFTQIVCSQMYPKDNAPVGACFLLPGWCCFQFLICVCGGEGGSSEGGH